ncbi:30S ribosomal protein S20 [Patescibacteria group bacterium]
MANKKSAKKALKQSKKRAFLNSKIKRNIKSLSKDTVKAVISKNDENAKKYSFEAIKVIDKAIQKGVLKKNTGARKKSALMKKINGMSNTGK